MHYKNIIDVLSDFSKISIIQLDIEGNIKKILLNSDEDLKIKREVNIKKIFSLEDRGRVELLFKVGMGEESKYLKILQRYSKGSKYVNLKIKEISGEIYAFLESTDTQREKELRYEAKLNSLSKKAELDQLTGLLNRHAYWDRVKRILNCGDPERRIGIIFLDMDGLKGINDKRGHKVGDKAISQIANLISRSIRERDIAVRYGGDEFIIVIEELSGSKSTAYGLAKRLLKEINSKRDNFLTTISIGVHITKVGDIFDKKLSNLKLHHNWEKEVVLADNMALKAKESGKNTIIYSKK